MTMVSFRIDDADVAEIERWARRLHIDRSELLRDALRRHLAELAADEEVRAYAENPVTEDEMALSYAAAYRVPPQDHALVSCASSPGMPYAPSEHWMLVHVESSWKKGDLAGTVTCPQPPMSAEDGMVAR
jgi:hypothetical protein